VDALFYDLTHSLRVVRHKPGFAGAVVAVLALGIGATVAVFSLVDAVFLKPLPYPDAGRIVVFVTGTGQDSEISAASPAKFNLWREQTSVFEDIAAYRYSRLNAGGADRPEQIRAALVSSGYLRLFGQTLSMGRPFTEDDDQPAGSGVVILSDAYWRRAFGGDPQAIGKILSLGGKPYEAIGIMAPDARMESPPSFDRANSREPIDVWIPLQIDPNDEDQNGYLSVAARLRPGIALNVAGAYLQRTTEEYRRRFGSADLPEPFVFAVRPMGSVVLGGGPASLWVLLGAVGLVLLIACANVAGLMLMQARGRQREVAIRAALGAGRLRIVRQLFLESAALSALGGVLGLLLGLAGVRLLLSLGTIGYARIGSDGGGIAADWRVLSFTIFVSLLTGILFGLTPALQLSRVDWNEALKQGGGRSGPGARENRARSLLVASEVALAVVLLIGAGLLVRTILALDAVEPGFDARNVLSMRLSLAAPHFQKSAAVTELVRDSLQRIRALPGVDSAAFTCCLPLEDRTLGGVIIAGRPLDGPAHAMVNISTVSSGYFDVLKIPIVRGRGFRETEPAGGEPVVILSEAMARRFWPNDDPLADALQASLVFPDLPAQPWRVIGIAGDVLADGLTAQAPAIVYFPIAQTPEVLNTYLARSPMAWLVRARVESRSLGPAVRQELSHASGGLPVSSIRSLDSVRTQSFAGRQSNMLLLSVFGGAALLLSAIGIYGLMAYTVERRRPEIAVRIALGAAPAAVRNRVVLQAMRLALLGQAAGFVIALALLRFLAGLLFGVAPHDAVVFAAVLAILNGVALLSSWLPAYRASRVDPMQALRAE
jgi:putative ABC transport system permease protein